MVDGKKYKISLPIEIKLEKKKRSLDFVCMHYDQKKKKTQLCRSTRLFIFFLSCAERDNLFFVQLKKKENNNTKGKHFTVYP